MSSLEHLESALSRRLESKQLKIPPYPAVAAKLTALARQKNGPSLSELAKVVSNDAALAAQVLGRAQSAANSGGRVVTTLFEALSRIGMEQLVEMALASGLGGAIIAPGLLSELRRDMWRRCLLSAQLARMLADNRGIAPETAYSAGLVHDLGASIAIWAIEDIAKEIDLPPLPEAQWRELVRRHQVKFGLVIAARWNLPKTLTEVIARASANPLVMLVELSDKIVAKLDHMPTVGLAALMDFEELSDIERCSIGSVVQEVVKSMASYSTPKPLVNSILIEAPAAGDQQFPVSFDVTNEKHQHAQARTISPDAIVFECNEAMMPNWLIEISLHCSPAPITMLVNVRSCDKVGTKYAIKAQPFALGGEAKQAWTCLVEAARTERQLRQ
jgi:HD-like signal output (HDOD) protein